MSSFSGPDPGTRIRSARNGPGGAGFTIGTRAGTYVHEGMALPGFNIETHLLFLYGRYSENIFAVVL